MKILITGGAGYIGSHTCISFLNAGYEVVVMDNLSNSKEEALHRVERITGKKIKFYKADLLDFCALEQIFLENQFDGVIHFAGLKAVGESVSLPLAYYENNIAGTLNLCKAMKKYGVYKLVFSSSATVYGSPKSVPITEDFPLSATNPYGQTKLMLEQILTDLQHAEPNFQISLLRYFNPIGAHESGLIGEDPNGIPNNLVPYIAQVAIGKLDHLNVYGDDYNTPDGTGVRDYIHVCDLANGHLLAYQKLAENPGLMVHNLGTGKGYSVLEMVHAFEKASSRAIKYEIAPRRSGDIAECYADTKKAEKELGFTAQKTLDDMCTDSWRWQKNNPNGYGNSDDLTLVVLAAGMGSRFGGLKQLEPIGENGEVIIDYSIYDAIKAGFNKVVFVIKKEIEDDFKRIVGNRIEKKIAVEYVYQNTPPHRKKPYGTGDAILCCQNVVHEPFVVINADDYYGADAYQKIHDYLLSENDYAMVAFQLKNTLTENGTVSRGVCRAENGYLADVTEHTSIAMDNDFPDGTIVSMNMWGLRPGIFRELEAAFAEFLNTADITKDELYIPSVIDKLIKNGKIKVKVLESKDKWYGVTYKEDKDSVVKAIHQLTEEGLYEGI